MREKGKRTRGGRGSVAESRRDRENDGHLRSAFFARSFIHLLTLLSLVSILSSLCVLLIYRAAGKCLRHSPSIVQPISLLFFFVLHLRASSRHFLFPSLSALLPFATVLHPSLPLLCREFLSPPSSSSEYID